MTAATFSESDAGHKGNFQCQGFPYASRVIFKARLLLGVMLSRMSRDRVSMQKAIELYLHDCFCQRALCKSLDDS